MPRIKGLPKQYNISEERFRELYYYCLQYKHWEKEMKREGLLPQRKEALRQKIMQIDSICYKANSELASYIRKGVTEKRMTYLILKNQYRIPCDRNTYYKYRRKFYWMLDKEKDGT